jgi:hypothetical protein
LAKDDKGKDVVSSSLRATERQWGVSSAWAVLPLANDNPEPWKGES